MVRVFIGIELPTDIKRYVVSIQRQFETLPAKSKFVEPENLHVSLSFIGEVEEKTVENIKIDLDTIANKHKNFEIMLNGLELIPNEKFIRVIALDVKSDELETLRKEIINVVGGESHPAHLTLARISDIKEKEKLVNTVKKIKCEEKTISVMNICLIQSTLRGQGPLYTILHKSYLK